MPPPAKGPKCHPCVRNTVLPISQQGHARISRKYFIRHTGLIWVCMVFDRSLTASEKPHSRDSPTNLAILRVDIGLRDPYPLTTSNIERWSRASLGRTAAKAVVARSHRGLYDVRGG